MVNLPILQNYEQPRPLLAVFLPECDSNRYCSGMLTLNRFNHFTNHLAEYRTRRRILRTRYNAGWHLATEDEWQRLEASLGMDPDDIARQRLRGPGLGDLLKIGGAAKLDIPLAGWRKPDGTFAIGNGNDTAAALWTATKADADSAWHRDLSSARSGIWRSPVTVTYSLSVRCVKDVPPIAEGLGT